MKELIIEGTPASPEVNFNPASGILKISGRAYSNDIFMFYKRLDSWLAEYLVDPKEITTIEFQLDYFNSVFNKLLILFFEKCKSVIQKDKKLIIKWYYQKDDMDCVDDADRISKIINFPIEKVKIE